MASPDPATAAEVVKWLRDKADGAGHNAAALEGQIAEMQSRVLKLRSKREQYTGWADLIEAMAGSELDA